MEKQTIIFVLILALGLAGAVYFFVLPEGLEKPAQEAGETERAEITEPTENKPGNVPLEIIEPTEDEIKIKEFKTDKETYGSYEKIRFSVKVSSKKDVEKAEIKITGIQPYQRAYINESKIVNLTAGENIVHLESETPYCTSGCGGVYPGPYDIHADIFINESLIESAKTTIDLVK